MRINCILFRKTNTVYVGIILYNVIIISRSMAILIDCFANVNSSSKKSKCYFIILEHIDSECVAHMPLDIACGAKIATKFSILTVLVDK